MTSESARSWAMLFPGQGAQFAGMGLRWYGESALARDLFETAEACSGLPIQRLCFELERGEQARTDWAQPCVFVASLAAWVGVRETQQALAVWSDPAFVAGHSLGHYTALVAAGALDFEAGLQLVLERGRLMADAAERSDGGMLAVVGLGEDRLADIVQAAGALVTIAAVNGSDQCVLTGERASLDRLSGLLEAAGAERLVPLAIALAAHSPLMAPAKAGLDAAIDAVSWRAPRLPVVLNTTGGVVASSDEVVAELHDHLLHPVQWWRSIQVLRAAGVTAFVDGGPGRTLLNVLRRDLPREQVHAVDAVRGRAPWW